MSKPKQRCVSLLTALLGVTAMLAACASTRPAPARRWPALMGACSEGAARGAVRAALVELVTKASTGAGVEPELREALQDNRCLDSGSVNRVAARFFDRRSVPPVTSCEAEALVEAVERARDRLLAARGSGDASRIATEARALDAAGTLRALVVDNDLCGGVAP